MSADRFQLYDYAGGKCCFCGRDIQESLDRYGTVKGQFEFNHIDPKKKHPDYDNLIQRKLSSEQLDEIDKCVLMCRTCHGLLHAQRISAKAVLRLRVGHLRRQQTYRACGIADFREKRFVFASDQDDELALFTAQYPKTPPRLMIKRDVEKQFLCDLLPCTKQHGSLLIRDINRTPLLRVDRLDSDHFQIEMDVRCPLFQMELHGEPGEPRVWVRNGRAVTADGEVMKEGVITLYRLPYAEWCRAQAAN
jgi:hypothetical protein